MRKIILLIFLLMAVVRINAQSVTVNAQIDSLQILIGEQTGITLEVSADTDKPIVMPAYNISDTIVRGVEIVDVIKPDSEYLNDGKRLLIKQKYIITSFDSALYYLPPMEVQVDNKTYESNPIALKVYSFPVDTLHPDEFYGPKDVLKPDFVWSDWYAVIACIAAILPMLWLLVYLIKRYRDNQPIIRKVKIEPKIPAHETAIKALEKIRSDKIWLNRGSEKEYYTNLSEVLRNYIDSRFHFNAMEMTSSEIIDKLLEMKDEEALKELKELFQIADLVKFAKYVPLMNENDANLLTAVKFVNDTKEVEDPDAKPEPTEITIVEKRPLRIKLMLGSAILLIVILSVLSAIYVAEEIYHYFF